MQQIIQSGDDEWKRIDGSTVISTNYDNLNIRVESTSDLSSTFSEPWLQCFPDEVAYRVKVEVFFGSSLVEELLFLSVDGARCTLPLPDRTTMTISRYHYAIGVALDQTQSLDEYLRMANITVV